MRLEVADDGVGGAEFSGGTGLVGLKDRVEALGGRIDLHSPRGGGTTLRVQLPLTGPTANPEGDLPARLAAVGCRDYCRPWSVPRLTSTVLWLPEVSVNARVTEVPGALDCTAAIRALPLAMTWSRLRSRARPQ